jgi:hypothetical protein
LSGWLSTSSRGSRALGRLFDVPGGAYDRAGGDGFSDRQALAVRVLDRRDLDQADGVVGEPVVLQSLHQDLGRAQAQHVQRLEPARVIQLRGVRTGHRSLQGTEPTIGDHGVELLGNGEFGRLQLKLRICLGVGVDELHGVGRMIAESLRDRHTRLAQPLDSEQGLHQGVRVSEIAALRLGQNHDCRTGHATILRVTFRPQQCVRTGTPIV